MKKIIYWILPLLILTVSFVSADIGDCPMGGMMYGQYGLGLGIFSWITSLLVIGLLIAGIYWLIKSANRKK